MSNAAAARVSCARLEGLFLDLHPNYADFLSRTGAISDKGRVCSQPSTKHWSGQFAL